MSKIKNPEWVGVYKLDGSLLSVYPTFKIASIELDVPLSDIKKAMNGNLLLFNDRILLPYDYSKTQSDIHLLIESRKPKVSQSKNPVRPIFQYDKKGNFIRQYDSIVEVVKHIPVSQASVSLCINGRVKTVKDYIVLRAKDNSDASKKEVEYELAERIEFIQKKKRGKKSRKIKETPKEDLSSDSVIQQERIPKTFQPIEKPRRKALVDMYHFDKGGSFIQMFSDVREIFNAHGVSTPTVRSVCLGNKDTCTQGIFLLKEDYPTIKEAQKEANRRIMDDPNSRSKKSRRRFEVHQFKKNGEFVNHYPSSKEASKALDINYSQLNQVLNGYIRDIKGFIFLYSKDYLSQEEMKQEVLERQWLSAEKIRKRIRIRKEKMNT